MLLVGFNATVAMMSCPEENAAHHLRGCSKTLLVHFVTMLGTALANNRWPIADTYSFYRINTHQRPG